MKAGPQCESPCQTRRRPARRQHGSCWTSEVPERVRLGELIRLRVREEVARYNASPVPFFSGLVQPDDSERLARSYLLRVPRTLDWRAQADAALRAFARNGFFVLVGDRQVDDLDE